VEGSPGLRLWHRLPNLESQNLNGSLTNGSLTISLVRLQDIRQESTRSINQWPAMAGAQLVTCDQPLGVPWVGIVHPNLLAANLLGALGGGTVGPVERLLGDLHPLDATIYQLV
jgi:hypothetical protein